MPALSTGIRIGNALKRWFSGRSSTPTPLERKLNMSINPVTASRFTGRGRAGAPDIQRPRGQLISNVVPIGIGGGSRAIGPKAGIASRIGGVLKSGYSRLYGPDTMAGFGKIAMSSALGAGAYGAVKYGVTGNPKDLLTGPRAFASLIGFRTAPVAGFAGAVSGTAEQIKDLGMTGINKISNLAGNVPSFTYPNVDFGNIFSGITPPQASTFNISTPSGGFISPPGASVSVVAGQGGGDFGLMQALLFGALGGLGGFFLGKRRKRKKYKRRKHRK